MRYREIVEGIFIDRPNRFIAHVDIEGVVNTVHVKNTGRCKELLIPKTPVRLEVSDNPNRKTLYDLVAVYKKNFGWINMDSQAPNKVVKEWLETKDYDYIKPEYKYGDSRIDFYMRKGNQEYLMEVKGCTLEKEGIAMFPDAPTARGVKHLHTLIKLAAEGKEAWMLFVIQMDGPRCFQPNDNIDPAFGQALRKAAAAGVHIHAVDCCVEKGGLFCQNPISVLLP